jgi:SPP1 gp7 family putative phage head morphogenesis protein
VPVEHVTEQGASGFRWGPHGKVYGYDPESPSSQRRARFLAERQGMAIHVNEAGRLDARPRRPIAPPPLFPSRIEESYRARLFRRVHAAQALLFDRLIPLLHKLRPELNARATAMRADSLESDLADILRVIEVTQAAFGPAFQPDPRSLQATAGQLDLFATKQQARAVKALFAIDIAPTRELFDLYQGWTRTNIDLITSIDARYFDDIRDTIVEAVRAGTNTEDITRLLRNRYQVSRSRAELIARDQIAKLNGQITEKRQRDLGVRRYQWSTSNDERVRPTHRVLEGKIIEWDKPPPPGHPGQDYQCRCVAIPYFDD